MKTIIFFLILLSANSYSFVFSKTDGGKNVHWNLRDDSVDLYIDINRKGTNVIGLTNSDIKNIIGNSNSQWNASSDFTMIPRFPSNRPSLGTSQTLSFSTNSAFFGSGTLAITSLGYDSKNGDILTARSEEHT